MTTSSQNLGYSKELISQILSALKENAAIMGEMTAEMRNISTELTNIKLSQEEMDHIFKDINAKKDLFASRIKQLEDTVRSINDDIKAIEDEKKEDKKSSLNNKILIVIAIMGALATILAAFIQIFPTISK